MLFSFDQRERTCVENLLKIKPFLLRRWVGTNKSLKERYTTEFMFTVSTGVPVILLFLTRSSKEFKEKFDGSKTFGFFSNKLSLDLGISSYFSSLVSSFQRATAQHKQCPSPLTMTSLLWGGISSDVLICLVNTLKSMKADCTYKYNWKILKELFSQWIMANFEICRDLYVRYDDLAIDLLRKETSLLLYFTICLVITLSKTCTSPVSTLS